MMKQEKKKKTEYEAVHMLGEHNINGHNTLYFSVFMIIRI